MITKLEAVFETALYTAIHDLVSNHQREQSVLGYI
jgi:hypothetical protein